MRLLNRYTTCGEVLLVLDVLIAGNHHVEPQRLRCLEEFAVFKPRMPLHLDKGANLMFRQEAPYTDGDVLIE